jgi:hypothetical protein
VKFADGRIAEDVEKNVVNSKIFYCEKDAIAVTRNEDSLDCPGCGDSMIVIGSHSAVDSETVAKFVFEAINNHKPSNTIEKNEGGVKMADSTEEVVVEKTVVEETVVEEPVVEEAVTKAAEEVAEDAAGETQEEITKAEETVVEETEALDLEKVLDDVKGLVEKSASEQRDAIDQINKDLEAAVNRVNERLESFSEALDGLKKDLGGLTTRHDDVVKRLGDVESSQAFRKSADANVDAGVSEKKGLWSGSMLSLD